MQGCNPLKIYLAGPLFTQAERAWNADLAAALTAADRSLQIFLPQAEADAFLPDSTPDFASIFRRCLEGLDAADVVVAILDGPDADSGTCFECGYAYAKGKEVIAVRTDIRAGEDEGLNVMLSRSAATVVRASALQHGAQAVAGLAETIASAVHRHVHCGD